MTQTIKAGAKGRKIGRKKRKPAQMRYTQTMRWEKNKNKRIAKDKKRQKEVKI